MTLKQCCLLAGVKKSHCIIYIKADCISHEIFENMLAFMRTGERGSEEKGNYPDLFSEVDILKIANKINPTVPSTKRIDRTLGVFETFVKSIQDRLHVIISMPCTNGTPNDDIFSIIQKHTLLVNEFYVDVYKPLKIDQIKLIACGFISDQLNEIRIKRYERLNATYEDVVPLDLDLATITKHDDADNEIIDYEELHVYSSILANLHRIASEHFCRVFTSIRQQVHINSFVVSIFKQIAALFFIYVERIHKHEKTNMAKYKSVLKSVDYVTKQKQKFVVEISQLNDHLVVLADELKQSEIKIEQQKNAYRLANDECRKEEKLVEEMSHALEKLKADTNQDFQDMNSASNPQYEAALRTLQALDEQAFNELKSYHHPPQRVIHVVDALCVMFNVEPDWDAGGKLLLIKENFFEQLLYYDKANIPDDIYQKLEKIIGQSNFRPAEIRPASVAAASLCEWIIAVYEYCSIARVINQKNKEINEYEELHKKRQTKLGEKRLFAEKERELLEAYCRNRINVLKEIVHTNKRIEMLTESRKTSETLLDALAVDMDLWTHESALSSRLLCTHKTDALLTACYVSYAGVFDYEQRERLTQMWLDYFKSTESIMTNDNLQLSKYSIRQDFKFKDLLCCDFDKATLLKLNKMSHQDKYYMMNTLILVEAYAYPTIHWPVLFDPESHAIKLIQLIQPLVAKIRTPYVDERLDDMRRESERLGKYTGTNDACTYYATTTDRTSASGDEHRSVSAMSGRSHVTQISEDSTSLSSSMCETTSTVSRSNGAGFVGNQTKLFLNSMLGAYKPDGNDEGVDTSRLVVTDVAGFSRPTNNLWTIGPHDHDLDSKLTDAAVHGVCVFLRNSERRGNYSRLAEKLINREFQVDSLQREYFRFNNYEYRIHPGFKIILHVSTPLHAYTSEQNYLQNRLKNESCAATAVLDFSLSYQYISSDLLKSIMDLEKPGYINQYTAAEKMYTEAQFSIESRHDEMIDNFTKTHRKFLTDKTVINYVLSSNMRYKSYIDSQEEALYTINGLLDKSKCYLKMSKTIAGLFDALKSILLIQPYYCVNWTTIKTLILRQIPLILRDKGALGPARANEVEGFCLNLVYHYFLSSLDMRHFTELVFFHSFWKCVKHNWLKTEYENMDKILSSKDETKVEIDLTKSENKLYASLEAPLVTVNTRISSIDDNVWKEKPDFLSLSAWSNCCELEKTIPDTFTGLTLSMHNDSAKWKEYFDTGLNMTGMVNMKEIDLLNDCPLKNQAMSIFDKLILWINAQPHSVQEIVKKFNVYCFGGFIPAHKKEFDLDFMFELTSQYDPVLILNNPKSNPFRNIKNEIIDKAKSVDCNIKVFTFSLDSDDSTTDHINQIVSTLKVSIKTGHWIIIDNVHLVEHWPRQLLDLVYIIKDAKHVKMKDFKMEYSNLRDFYFEHKAEQLNLSSVAESLNDIEIHDNHRLWLISNDTNLNSLPMTLVYDSIKITPEISNFEQTLKSSTETAASFQSINASTRDQSCLLFSILAKNNYSKAYHWRLDSFREHLQLIDNLKHNPNHDELLKNLLIDQIYCSQSQANIDYTMLKNLVLQSLEKKSFDLKVWEKYSECLSSAVEYDLDMNEMTNELRLIFSIRKNMSALDVDENGLADYDRSAQHLTEDRFNQNLVSTLQTSIEKIKLMRSQIESSVINEPRTETDDAHMIRMDLVDYNRLFGLLVQKLDLLVDSLSGKAILCHPETELFRLLFTKTKSSQCFMQIVHDSLSNASDLLSQWQTAQIGPIDLKHLFDVRRFVCDFVRMTYANLMKVKDNPENRRESLTQTIKNEQKFFKDLTNGKCDFTLQVFENEELLNFESNKQNDCLAIKQLSIANAYYDTLSNGFKTTHDNKFKTVVNFCKLVPFFKNTDDFHEGQLQPIPFYTNDLKVFICKIYVKFDEVKNRSTVDKKKYSQNLVYFYTECLAQTLKNSIIGIEPSV